MLVTPKTMLRIRNRFHPPGQETEIPEELAGKLLAAGLVERAVVSPTERAVSEYHTGAGWYEVRGQKVRGKEAALELLEEVDECESR